MTVRYVIERHFTRGNLKGLDHRDTMTFVDDAHAKRWQEGVQRNIERGTLNYRLTGFYPATV